MRETPTTTFGLIERLKQGDRAAFTPLFDKYQGRLAVLIHYKLREGRRHPEDVDEILQETFLAAFEDLRQFQYQMPGSFLNWLSRIAGDLIVDETRAGNRQQQRSPMTLAQREEVDSLLKKLNALPQQYREIILLAKIEGLSIQEMAERLGKSRESVALLLRRAIQGFRETQT